MKDRLFLFMSFALFSCLGTWAYEVTDTLESTKRDRVIISYDITQSNGKIVIKFLDSKKKLGSTFKDKYKKLDQIAVVFFDRTGNYEDNMEFSGINTEAFMIPKEINYPVSKDGYFLLNDNPTLSLELKSSETAKLSIPIFLAHYEGKRRYKIFSRCEDLVVNVSRKRSANPNTQDKTMSQQISQTITSQEEIEGGLSETEEAEILINKIKDILPDQEEFPFSSELEQAISSLRNISYRLKGGELSSKVNDVLSECKAKETRLKEEAKTAAKNAELLAKEEARQAQARQDSIAAAAQLKAEEDKKMNLWLIIGGVALAILGFAGNQALQHFRNAKNQKNIMDMQANVVKQAEDEAKRRAKNMTLHQVNNVRDEAKRNTRNVIKEGIGKVNNKGKGKKGFSI